MSRKLVYGYGINDAEREDVEHSSVMLWRNTLQRCLSLKFKEKWKSYADCTLHREWYRYSAFRQWYDVNFVEGYHLDKDILIPGNKEYGPDTCRFVPRYLNSAFVLPLPKNRGSLLGVTYVEKTSRMVNSLRNNYYAKISINGSTKCLGMYPCPEKAHHAWQIAKVESLKLTLHRYESEPHSLDEIRDSVMSRIHKIENDILLCNITESL